MRPPVRLPGGLAAALFEPLHLAIQYQWCLVVQRLAVWRRAIAAASYWELTRLVPECSAVSSCTTSRPETHRPRPSRAPAGSRGWSARMRRAAAADKN